MNSISCRHDGSYLCLAGSKKRGRHNLSLQLSPKRSPGTANAVLSIQQGAPDAAGQLNSMLELSDFCNVCLKVTL
jgi:hypothetical protein